ncbi:type IV pilus assembly protein PilM [bacterium]|nr:type IV pilus assembly protein PilM [bacterium]
MGIFSKARPVVGLDIGTSSVKAVVLKGSSKGYQLQNLGIETLPPEVIVDGAIMDAEVVVEAIQTVFNKAKIKLRDVAVAVSGTSVIVKKITLPDMDPKELSESIQWEAEQYIPFDIEDVNLDFQILNRGVGDGSEMDVILVAVKKDKIHDYIGLVAQAGLDTKIVDVDGFALSNQFEVNYPSESGETVALIDMGSGVMNINILQDGQHVLYRDISLGGNQFTDAIQKELNVSYEQAEALKKGEEVEGINPSDVTDIINSVIEDISMEIQRSFDYYRATTSSETVDKVVLTGGCSKIAGIDSFLASKLSTKIELGNPFRNIAFPKKFDPAYLQDVAPLCAIAVGLAARKVGDK